MDIYKTNLFPYVTGDSLAGKEATVTMTTVTEESLPSTKGGQESKYILRFKESSKGLILNRTNAKVIAGLYGSETDGWAGQRITLYSERVKAFGETHNAVRVKAPKAAKPDKTDVKPASQDAPPMAEQMAIAAAPNGDPARAGNYYTRSD